jgi:hypothetical protein
MARWLYWSVYKLDMGPLGPMSLKLAPRIWLASSRRRTFFRPLIDSSNSGFAGAQESVAAPAE